MPESLIDLAGLRVGAEEFLVALLETTRQPFCVIDHDGVVRFANPAAVSALGYEDAGELLRHGSHATMHYGHKGGTPSAADECLLLRPLRSGDTVTSALDWFIRRDGSMFPVSFVSVPLETPDGRVAVAAFTDIEDRLRAEALGLRDTNLATQYATLRDELARLADEQAALRRVATLVARAVPPPDLFAAVARELGLLLDGDTTHIARYEGERTATLIASWSRGGDPIPIGTVAPIDGENVCSLVLRSGRPARMSSYDDASGPIAAMLRRLGVRSSIGAPIIVGGRRWGVAIVSSKGDEPLRREAEERIGAFTELVATAISNTEAQRERGRLADQQAALRRVATLVAEGVPATELFGAVTKEVGQLLGVDAAAMIRYEGHVMTAVGNWTAEGVEADTEVGRQWPFEGDSLAPRILETGQSARIDDWRNVPGPVGDYVRAELGLSSSVGTPILVAGQVWGNIVVHSTSGQLPADTEERLEHFTELVATAISNSEARAEVGRLAEEQAALRRVATLVARESPPDEVFAAVAEEVGRLLHIEDTRMFRYEPDGGATVVASWGRLAGDLPVGTHLTLDGESASALVMRTGRAARINDFTTATGGFAASLRNLGVHSAVGAPIIVEGRLWGAMTTASLATEPLPPDTEARMRQFTELAATAISNVETRLDLAASRARIVMATDAARRRFERDLHDGAQQRLVSLALELQGVQALAPHSQEELRSQLSHVGHGLAGVLDELRELSRGIHPAILSEGGLKPALGALARRSTVPVKLQVDIDGWLDEGIEVAAYYVVSEALANTAKHADASEAGVTVEARQGTLDLVIDDDGVGGADPAHGSGLLGLIDRVEALGGTISIISPSGAGTSVHVEFPAGMPATARSPRP
jgi:PAS domain S-box-containing protein